MWCTALLLCESLTARTSTMVMMLHSTRPSMHHGHLPTASWTAGRGLICPMVISKSKLRVAYDEKVEVVAAPVQPNVVPIPAHLAAHAIPQVGRSSLPAGQQEEDVAAPRLSWWQAAINSASARGQHVVIEFYAGWCASCKASFGHLCKLPQDAQLQGSIQFYKANVDADEGVFWWMKRAGIRALPYMAVWGPRGDQLIIMSSSFKKMQQVKASLQTMVAHPTATKFVLDEQGLAQPCGLHSTHSVDIRPADDNCNSMDTQPADGNSNSTE